MIEINRNPSVRERRQFILIWMPLFFALAGAIAWWRFGAPVVAGAIWAAGLILATLGLAFPAMQRPLYVGWMRAAYPIGWTVSHLLLLIIFYVLITPLGLAMRALRRDPMQREFDRSAESYWTRCETTRPVSSYFRQY